MHQLVRIQPYNIYKDRENNGGGGGGEHHSRHLPHLNHPHRRPLVAGDKWRALRIEESRS